MKYIGERIILQTLLRDGKFLGTIIDIDFMGTCLIKLDCQEEPVAGVLYYHDGPPEIVNSNLLQICWPENW